MPGDKDFGKEQAKSLVEKITDGSITAEELQRAGKLGSAELDAIKVFVKWLADEAHYQLKDEGSGLEQGTQTLLDAVKKKVKQQLELKKWSTVSGIDWDKLVEEQSYS